MDYETKRQGVVQNKIGAFIQKEKLSYVQKFVHNHPEITKSSIVN